MFRPEMSDLDAVFSELAADAEVTADFSRSAPCEHLTTQRSERDQGRRADSISRFFVRLVVIARHHSAIRLACWSSGFIQLMIAGDRGQTIWFVTEKDMSNFFHQRGPVSLHAVGRIQDYESPTVWQGPRTGAA